MSEKPPNPATSKADGAVETKRFAGLTFEDFRRRAADPTLSRFEKIGFPDALREGYEAEIFADIRAKLTGLQKKGATILDVGPGCSDLPRLLVEHCVSHEQRLFLMDAQEMLDQLPDAPGVSKVAGRFPRDGGALVPLMGEGADAIIVYSVLQHVFMDANPFAFLDELLGLLKPGGELLLGDIPNISKLHRFLSSEAGIVYHKQYMRTDEPPEVVTVKIEHGRITDAVVLGLVERARTAGFDAYVLPQPASLPMANRREDIYVRRP